MISPYIEIGMYGPVYWQIAGMEHIHIEERRRSMKHIFVCFIAVLVLLVPFQTAAFADPGEDPPDGGMNVKEPVYTDSEIETVARVVYGEARGEPFAGQVAVANVLVNRLESGKYGKSIWQVASAPNQFSVAGDTNDECLKAAKYVMLYNIRPLPGNTFYFRTSPSRYWRTFKYYGRIGHHSFYTDGAPVIEDLPYATEFSDTQEFLTNLTAESILSELKSGIQLH